MKIFKPKFWSVKNSLIAYFLFPLSIFIQALLILRNKITKVKKFSIPVICVGNIYIGGTGKTPLSIEIAKILEKFNKKTAIIKKSYKEHVDEFKLIESKQVSLFINSSRHTAINDVVKNKFDYAILDDGFQDFSVNKDLNIVCFNEKQLIGNGMTFPSGPLRESLSSLKRCQIIVINGGRNIEFEKQIKIISSNISIYYSKYLPTNIEDFKNKNLIAFAGIGNPENFFDLLESNKLKIIKKISYPDHYNYTLQELNDLVSFSLENNLKIITTEKDFYRIKHFHQKQIEYLNIKLEISNKDQLAKEIIKFL
jgi:tetraacyldisaccharide 4'-kinase